MAFVYAVTSLQSSLIVGYWYITNGTFVLTGATVKGEIVTGLSNILTFATHITSGTLTEQLEDKANSDEAGASSPGSIGILAAAADIVGTWQAIGVI